MRRKVNYWIVLLEGSKIFSIFIIFNRGKILNIRVLNFLKPNTDGTTSISSRVRDIDLKLQTPEDTHAVLEALTDNYMIKTVRLSNLSKVKISEETQKLAESLKSSRVGSEIRVSFSNKKINKSKTSSIEVYYPDTI